MKLIREYNPATRPQHRKMKRYAELCSNVQNLRIKSLRDNRIVGNKGVVSTIWKDEDMPVDDFGIRAEIIMNSSAVFNRISILCL